MTYLINNNIQAADFNTFAGQINTIYSDTNSGATALPLAGYGYGQPTTSTTVAGSTIVANTWSAFFSRLRAAGTHQGTTVAPPVPTSDPTAGTNIVAFNTPVMSGILTLLNTNRFNIAAGQGTLTSASFTQQAVTWTNTLAFSCDSTFLSWNAMRYFFNAGGYISVAGSYPSTATADDLMWANAFSAMSTIKISYNSSTGTNSTIGFYGLTTTPVEIYSGYGSGAYSSSLLQLKASLNSAAGAATKIVFSLVMYDNDSGGIAYKPIKSALTSITVNNLCATGAVTTAAPVTSNGVFTLDGGVPVIPVAPSMFPTSFLTPGTWSYTVPTGAHSVRYDYLTPSGTSSATISVVPGQIIPIVIGQTAYTSIFNGTQIPAFNAPAVAVSGNVDRYLDQTITIATATSTSYSGTGGAVDLAAGAAANGIYYAETYETSNGDIAMSIALTPVVISPMFNAPWVWMTAWSGRGTFTIPVQPTASNAYRVSTRIDDNSIVDQGSYSYTISVTHVVTIIVTPIA